MAETELPDIETTIATMIREQGDMWAESVDVGRSSRYSAVVITDSPEHCYRLTLHDGEWRVQRDVMTVDELREFFVAFGSHWGLLWGALLPMVSGPARVRAFTKNTYMIGGWSISIDISGALKSA